MKSEATLHAVSARVRSRDDARTRLEAEAAQWVEAQLREEEEALENAVMVALEDEHSVASVARAYTISGKTPNRNKIYEIKNRNADKITTWRGDYPFKWVGRTVRSRDGERTVHDIHSYMQDFGPDHVTGTFMWRYDLESKRPEPLFVEGEEPYPYEKYYIQILDKWLVENPYPEEVA